MDRFFAWPKDGENHNTSTPNPQTNPTVCGLEIIGQLNDPNACYSYDDIIAWKDIETGDIYVAHDAGCSCPTPFGNIVKLSDMVRIHSTQEIKNFVDLHQDKNKDEGRTWPLRDVFKFLAKVESQLQPQPPTQEVNPDGSLIKETKP